jgi:ligand-binding sensor domain-containing protein
VPERSVPGLVLDIEPYRSSRDVEPRVDRQLARLLGSTYHYRFAPDDPPFRAWTSYASLRYVRDVDVDAARGQVWLATWGGVLCWSPDGARCVRHTSEHGLCGNATRCLAVDEAGVVWAAGQESGLCSLLPGDGQAWHRHGELDSCTVLCMVSRPGVAGGVYLALRGHDGRCALGEIPTRTEGLHLLAEGDLQSKDVVALLWTKGALWTGNAWGLHHVGSDGQNPFGPGELVRALASAQEGGLWIGTNRGLFRWDAAASNSPTQEPGWPRDEVLSLAPEEYGGTLWVATVREVGRVVDGRWQPVAGRPRGRLTDLFPVTTDPQERVWAGGAGGLCEIAAAGDAVEAVFPAPQDALSNAVQCLWAGGSDVWVGTARGLFHFDGQHWRHDRVPGLRDVRAIVPRPSQNEVWVGAWQGGLQCLEEAVYVRGAYRDQPVVALARGSDDSLWAATVDTMYHLLPGSQAWQPLPAPAREQIGGALIQVVGYHVSPGTGGERVPLLWVGTSAGLFCYRPGLEQWDLGDWELGDLRRLPILTLALDPSANRLWAGTPAGLFGEHRHVWRRYLEGEVRAVAFGPDGTLWLGRRTGLERWAPPGDNRAAPHRPEAVYSAQTSGLAANEVTALAVHATPRGQEVWVGSPAGVSRYRTWRDQQVPAA